MSIDNFSDIRINPITLAKEPVDIIEHIDLTSGSVVELQLSEAPALLSDGTPSLTVIDSTGFQYTATDGEPTALGSYFAKHYVEGTDVAHVGYVKINVINNANVAFSYKGLGTLVNKNTIKKINSNLKIDGVDDNHVMIRGEVLPTRNAFNNPIPSVSGVAIGDGSKSAGRSVGIGYLSEASGFQSVSVGYDNNSEGMDSVAIGGKCVSKGENSVCIGNYSSANGGEDIAIGVISNTLEGKERQIAIGWEAITQATNAIAIGRQARATNDNAMALGLGANATGQNSVALGNDTVVNSNNTIVLGNDNHTVKCNDLVQTSDFRDKTDISQSTHGLDFVNRLKPVKFKRNEDSKYYYREADGNIDFQRDNSFHLDISAKRMAEKCGKRYHHGIIAQDVLELQKELNDENAMEFSAVKRLKDGDDYSTDPNIRSELVVDYSQFIAPLIKAIQELSKKVDTLEKKIQGEKNAI